MGNARFVDEDLVEQRLAVCAAFLLASFFRREVHRTFAGIAVDAVALQRMRGVDHTFDRLHAIACQQGATAQAASATDTTVKKSTFGEHERVSL